MKVKTGSRKTPDGYYLIVIELAPGEEEPLSEEELKKLGVKRDGAGNVVFYMTRSRRIQKLLVRMVLRGMKRRSYPER